MRAWHSHWAVDFGPTSASALWPGVAREMPLKQPQQVTLYTRCGRAPKHPGQEQEQLRAHPMKLVRRKRASYRLTGVTAAVRELCVGDKEAVGLLRLPCGRLLLERWCQQAGQGQGRGQRQRRLHRQQQGLSGEAMDTEWSGG